MKYKRPAPKRIAKTEHNETVFQNNAINKGELKTHPAIGQAIETFANNPKSFTSALLGSKIESLKGQKIANSEYGAKNPKLDPAKKARATSESRQDRSVMLRYKDRMGNQFNHMLSGDTRATVAGDSAEAHVIELGNK